ncbi:hypothetical protein ACIHAX_15770 [Nocardia sp. NPDC051929]
MLAVATALLRLRKWPLIAKLLSWAGLSTFVTEHQAAAVSSRRARSTA